MDADGLILRPTAMDVEWILAPSARETTDRSATAHAIMASREGRRTLEFAIVIKKNSRISEIKILRSRNAANSRTGN